MFLIRYYLNKLILKLIKLIYLKHKIDFINKIIIKFDICVDKNNKWE